MIGAREALEFGWGQRGRGERDRGGAPEYKRDLYSLAWGSLLLYPKAQEELPPRRPPRKQLRHTRGFRLVARLPLRPASSAW